MDVQGTNGTESQLVGAGEGGYVGYSKHHAKEKMFLEYWKK